MVPSSSTQKIILNIAMRKEAPDILFVRVAPDGTERFKMRKKGEGAN